MKNKIHVFYPRVLDLRGESITVGGIQNYLINLCDVLAQNYNICIIQTSKINFLKNYQNHQIRGYKINLNNNFRIQISDVYKKHQQKIDKNDIVIWGSDRISNKINHERVITIQHGISFDYIPFDSYRLKSLLKISFFSKIYKLLQNQKALSDFNKSTNMVCVDYNYVNWLRAVYPRQLCNNLTVIPNFSVESMHKNIIEYDEENIYILFARRFHFMRGVNILIDIIDYILPRYSKVFFTICGEGPMEQFLKNKYKHTSNVQISKYQIGEAEIYNLKHHISLIPTYGSEGTSFSLLESMGAGCVPLASNVGGMTNVILDGHNGYLLPPDSDSFIEKLCYLIDNRDELHKISINAKKSIAESFSKEIWKNKWESYINKLYKI